MYVTTEEQIGTLLPPEPAKCFLDARAAYLQADFKTALQLDRKVLAWAEAHQHRTGQILGHRFIGLCHFRLDALDESTNHLTEALRLAEDASCLPQVLLCANHLGATLRRAGKLLEAYELFRQYLKQATLPTYIHERARLYGNYGALLDQLGQRAAADDGYARLEELCELLGNPDRLANARGLAARSADLRDDQETALHKYEDERRLAEQSGNVARQVAATLHMARMNGKLKRFRIAEKLCEQGLKLAQAQKHKGRLIDAWECRAEISQLQGKLAASYRATWTALEHLDEATAHPEKRANNLHRLAVICRDAGLHGEALHHLMDAAQVRWKLFAPLRAHKRLAKMAQDRFRELEELARELLQEGSRVNREPEERSAIQSLIRQIWNPSEKKRSDKMLEAQLGSPQPEDISQWPERQREKAEALWKKRLLPDTFSKLLPESQEDLIRAEVSYSTTVSDLPRFAHLLAVVVERELRERIIIPAAKAVFQEQPLPERWERASLGDILGVLAGTGNLPKAKGVKEFIAHALGPQNEIVGRILRLKQPLQRADNLGESFKLVELRNAVAHGEDVRRFPKLNRLTVDAVKRALVLEDDPPLLAQIARLRLPPSPSNKGRTT